MEQVLIVFSSITTATGVKKHLAKKYNIPSKLRQTPKKLATMGCSYCLEVGEGGVETVKKIAKENVLTIRGIYREDGSEL